MSTAARTPLHAEMQVAAEVIAQLQAAGIDLETDPDFADLLASETDVQNRLVRILRAARHAEAQASAVKAIEAENAERRKRLDAKADRLRDIVLHAMAGLGLKRIEAPDLTATLGTGRPKVIVTDEGQIPGRFFVTSRTLDKRSVSEALKEGPVLGVELSNAASALTVRTR